MEKRRKDDQWHIGKTLDLGHITTTVMLVIGAFWFFSDLNTRITVVEARSVDRDKTFQELKADIKEIKDLLWEIRGEK